jgi:CO dehydrogenase/acetyl-CoA synthase beta subunit
LHCLDECPTTGCGCFNFIMFKTALPRPGVGIMEAGYKGRSPDGRSWKDLHYALAGKQTPGMAGGSAGYLSSRQFLRAHGGWKSVVWVSARIAEAMGDKLPRGIEVGTEA